MSATTHDPVRGMAFDIDDLVRVRLWAERNGLTLRIRLDHIERGQNMEEVLYLAPLGRGMWRVSMWREHGGVAMRQGAQPPARHASLEAALAAAAPRRGLWTRMRPF